MNKKNEQNKTARAIGLVLAVGFGVYTGMCEASGAELTVSKIISTPDSHKSQIRLSDGREFSVPLERLKTIAVLKTPSGSPKLLMSGADCTECDMSESIYVLEPVNQTGILPRSSYPGTLKTYDTGETVQKTRMFYGHCLSNDDSVIWSTDFLGEDNKWHHQDSVIRIKDDGSSLVELTPSEFNLKSILKLTSSGVCKELKGMNGTTEP